jgi:hypothetical protein
MAKIQAGAILDLVTFSRAENKLGDVKSSMLTLAEFQAEHLGEWRLMDGASCVGTAYATLKGVTTVPNATTDGTFLRQAKAGRALGSFEADENKAHGHTIFGYTRNGAIGGAVIVEGYNGGVAAKTADFGYANNSGGLESRPKNVAVNFFIKVNY